MDSACDCLIHHCYSVGGKKQYTRVVLELAKEQADNAVPNDVICLSFLDEYISLIKEKSRFPMTG